MLALLAASALATIAETPKVVSASIFGNGLGLVARQVNVETSGKIEIDEIPQAIRGTFWLTASPGIAIKSVTTSQQTVPQKRNAQSLEEILAANVGRTIKIGITGGDERFGNSATGKLLSASGSTVVLQTDAGGLALSKDKISMVGAPNGDLLYTVVSQSKETILTIDAEAKQPGKVTILDVEKGLFWEPAYSIDLEDGHKLSIEAKATIANNLEDFTHVDLHLVNGSPVSQDRIEPLLGGDFALLSGGLIPQGIQFVTYDPTDNSVVRETSGNVIAGAAPSFFTPEARGVENEDLFYYSEPNFTVAKGDRSMVMLFEDSASYEDAYEADLADAVQDNGYGGPQMQAPTVEHNVRFKNKTGHPFIAAGAILARNGDIVGDSYVSYTAKGAEATVLLGAAPDVQVSSAESEVSRARASLKLPDKTTFDLVSLSGRVSAQNFKAEPITLQVVKALTGTVDSADNGASVEKSAPALGQINAGARIKWTLKLAPQEKRTLNYSYKVYLKTAA